MVDLQLRQHAAQPGQRPLDHRAALAFALHAQHAVVAVVAQQGEALLDVLGVDAVAQRAVAHGDAGLLAARGRGQRLGNVLDVDVAHPVDEPRQERHRVLAGDERVARVHVHPQVGAVAEVEHPGHELGLGGEVAVRLDVDDDLVGLGHLDDLLVARASSGPWPLRPSGPAGACRPSVVSTRGQPAWAAQAIDFIT